MLGVLGRSAEDKAKKFIPGMTQLLSKHPSRFSEGVWPSYYQRAKGSRIWDLDGNCYVDMSIGGIGANVLGYADEDVDKAVCQAIQNGSSSSLNCIEEVELAEALTKIHPWAQKVRFTRSGGEAMAVAIRIARTYTGKSAIAFCGYHGWHDWYLSANLGHEAALDGHLIKGLPPSGVPKELRGTTFAFHYNDLASLQKTLELHGKNIGAIVMEPLRNYMPDPGFLEGVKELCKQFGCVFIFDEISSGFRFYPGGVHLQFGIEPDICVFSKALGNGYPIAAIIGHTEVMDASTQTFISSTSWTERIGPVAALAVIDKFLSHQVHLHLGEVGQMVQAGWQSAANRHDLPIKLSGLPALGHFQFLEIPHSVAKAYFVQCMLERGFLASDLFYAMLSHTKKDIENYVEAVDDVFAQISKDRHELEKKIKGLPPTSGFARLN